MNTTAHAHDVMVVGAGLAGLTCAHHLRGHDLDVVVLEAGDVVGGRVRTDVVDGFRLARGFQVLNTAYPEVGRVLDLDALGLCALDSAAVVHVDGRHVRLPNPLRRPTAVKDLVTAPLGEIVPPAPALARSFRPDAHQHPASTCPSTPS